MTTRSSIPLAMLLALVPACDDGGMGVSDATEGMSDATLTGGISESTNGSTDGDCDPGHEGCQCVDGDLCLAGLSCMAGICVDLGGATTGTGTASDTGETSDSDGTQLCDSSLDCEDTEVCVDGVCGDTDNYYFTVIVEYFDPPDCLDGWGSAELYYDYYMEGVFQGSSLESECPGGWPLEILDYDSLQAFELEFWEADAFEDDFITSLCWGDQVCDPIPKQVLHDGGWAGLDGSGQYYIDLTIDVADGYP